MEFDVLINDICCFECLVEWYIWANFAELTHAELPVKYSVFVISQFKLNTPYCIFSQFVPLVVQLCTPWLYDHRGIAISCVDLPVCLSICDILSAQ